MWHILSMPGASSVKNTTGIKPVSTKIQGISLNLCGKILASWAVAENYAVSQPVQEEYYHLTLT